MSAGPSTWHRSNVIQADRISKSYGAARALAGIKLRVREGEALRLLGPNGSGKSTLLGVLGTLIAPSSGQIDFGSFGASPEQVRRVLGWLGHGAQSYPALSGRELLVLHLQLHGRPVLELDGLAERFDLASFWDRPMGTYSKGQAQRVALARALSHAPRLVLLDEPTTGLDARSTAALASTLKQLHVGGCTLIMVSHDLHFCSEVPWRDLWLERGRLVDAPI